MISEARSLKCFILGLVLLDHNHCGIPIIWESQADSESSHIEKNLGLWIIGTAELLSSNQTQLNSHVSEPP